MRKVTISFVMSVRLSLCLSVRPSVRPHETSQLPLDGFSWNLTIENFSKTCPENSNFINKKSDKKNGYFIRRPVYVYDNVLLNYSWNGKRIKQKLQRKTKHTVYIRRHFSPKIVLFFFLDNVGEILYSPTATIQHMRISRKLSKATNAHSEYVIQYCLPTAIMVAPTRPSIHVTLKGAMHSQLNWAILLCDVIPDGKTE